MHELVAEYKENDCKVRVEGKEPYIILNLEKYSKLKGLDGMPHCDFVYISFKDSKCEVFLVELKDVKSDRSDKLFSSIQNKFPQTLNLIRNELLNALGIASSSKYYGVVVLPQDIIDILLSLLRRGRIHIGGIRDLDSAWVAPCGGDVWDILYSLKA